MARAVTIPDPTQGGEVTVSWGRVGNLKFSKSWPSVAAAQAWMDQKRDNLSEDDQGQLETVLILLALMIAKARPGRRGRPLIIDPTSDTPVTIGP